MLKEFYLLPHKMNHASLGNIFFLKLHFPFWTTGSVSQKSWECGQLLLSAFFIWDIRPIQLHFPLSDNISWMMGTSPVSLHFVRNRKPKTQLVYKYRIENKDREIQLRSSKKSTFIIIIYYSILHLCISGYNNK